MLRNGNLGPTRAENGGLSRGTYPICIYMEFPPPPRGGGGEREACRRPECSQTRATNQLQRLPISRDSPRQRPIFTLKPAQALKGHFRAPRFLLRRGTYQNVGRVPPPPQRIFKFPNRLAMARVLCLWRSIEKKGSESEASRQMSGYYTKIIDRLHCLS